MYSSFLLPIRTQKPLNLHSSTLCKFSVLITFSNLKCTKVYHFCSHFHKTLT